MPFMPWQQEVADVAMEIDPETGRLAYREIRVTVPRQSGKTSLMLSLVLHRALGQANQQIRYTAQTGSDARKKWEDDWLPVLDRSRFKPFYRVRKSNGHEALIFRSGSLQGLLATAEESGHGGSVDLAIADESFAHKDARIEQAVKPAMSTRPEPQFWLPSTAGTPLGSPYLYPKVLGGRKIAEEQATDVSKRRGVCYIEFSAPDDADPMDPKTWWACMPALGYTQTEDGIAADLQSMLDDPKKGLSEFRRAYLNQWVLSMGDPVVPLDHWQTLARENPPRPEWVVLGLAVAPDDASAALVACGEFGNQLQSLVLEHGESVDWLFPRAEDAEGALARACREWGSPFIVVDEKQCAHLLPEIERAAGFDRVQRRKPTEVREACAFWRRLAMQSRLLHCGEPELQVALAGAERRRVLEGWSWAAIKSGSDITPLMAQTLAASFWLGSWGQEDD